MNQVEGLALNVPTRRIEQHNDERNNLPTVESRIAFSEGHRAAMNGEQIPKEMKTETAEARSFRNGYEAGKRARAVKC
jgi:hypothetical protein